MRATSSAFAARQEIVVLAAIMLLAVFLRMAYPGLSEFKLDEARLYSLALDMAELKSFAVRGIDSSVGIPNFPTSVWLYALSLLFWKHPYAATLFTGLLNSAAVLGCWWLARRYWGTVPGLCAALMFASAPWAIFHSQKIWAQNLLAPFTVLWAISGALAFIESRHKFVLLHLLSLALAIQVHFAAVALLPATVVFLLVFRRRVNWRWVLGAVLVILLVSLPVIVHLIRSAAISAEDPFSFAASLQRDFSLDAWRYILLLTTGREIHALAGSEAFRDFLTAVPDLTAVHLVWAMLVIAGVIYLLDVAVRRWGHLDRRTEAVLLLLAWLFAPPLLFTVPLLPVELHYMLPAFPAPFIVAAIAFGALHSSLGRFKIASWIAMLVMVALQVWIWLALLFFLGEHNTPGGYGTPLHYLLRAVDQAKEELTRNSSNEVLVAGQSENARSDAFAAIYDVLLRDVPHRFVNLDRSAVFPAGDAVVLVEAQADSPLLEGYLNSALSVKRLPLRQGEGLLQILTLPSETAPEPAITLQPPALFANWVSIIGYDAIKSATDGLFAWQLYWHTAAEPQTVDYHFFNHLLDADGDRVAQEDAALFSPLQWREGDTVVSIFYLSLPSGAHTSLTMRTGIYIYPSVENVPLLDVAGNPSAEALELPVMLPE